MPGIETGMRRIDLISLIASPIAAGICMTYGGLVWAIILICAWNLIAWLPVGLLLARVHRTSPLLWCALFLRAHAMPPSVIMLDLIFIACPCFVCPKSSHLGLSTLCRAAKTQDPEGASAAVPVGASGPAKLWSADAWMVYTHQTVVLPANALALLYMTVWVKAFLETAAC